MKRILQRALTMLLILCLCAALAGPAFAAEHELNRDNDWSMTGELILPGDTFVIVPDTMKIQNDAGDTYVYILGASLTKDDARWYLSRLTTSQLPSLDGITLIASKSGDLTEFVGEEGDGRLLVDGMTYTWATGYRNDTGLPIELRNVRGYSDDGGCVTPEGAEPKIYIIPQTRFGMDFVVYEPSYAIEYENMTEAEIALAPDHYDITPAEQTLTLPVLQRPGKLFRGYSFNPYRSFEEEGVLSEDGTTISYTFTWDDIRDSVIGNETATPVFDDAYTVEFEPNGGALDVGWIVVEPENAASFDLSAYVPVREGYTFVGWSTDEDSPSVVPDGYGLEDYMDRYHNYEVHFYAVWQDDAERADAPIDAAWALGHLGALGPDRDADGDEVVTEYDAALLLQFAVGRIPTLPKNA